jgi:hypothetical protein
MRLLLYLLLVVIGCPLAALSGTTATVAPPTTMPTLTPVMPPVLAPRIEISATAQTLKVGDTVTLTGIPVGIGIPYYTLKLSSGGSFTVTYTDEIRDSTPDALFEVVEAHAEMNLVTFTLRALAPGSADATISATGEVRSQDGAFSWGGGSSAPLALTVTD